MMTLTEAYEALLRLHQQKGIVPHFSEFCSERYGTDRWYLQDYDSRDTWYISTVEALAVPEPTALALMSIAAAALLRRRQR